MITTKGMIQLCHLLLSVQLFLPWRDRIEAVLPGLKLLERFDEELEPERPATPTQEMSDVTASSPVVAVSAAAGGDGKGLLGQVDETAAGLWDSLVDARRAAGEVWTTIHGMSTVPCVRSKSEPQSVPTSPEKQFQYSRSLSVSMERPTGTVLPCYNHARPKSTHLARKLNFDALTGSSSAVRTSYVAQASPQQRFVVSKENAFI